MQFDLTQLVGGKPLAKARELLRRGTSFSASRAAELLSLSEGEALDYLEALTQAGFLEREQAPVARTFDVFVPTLHGSSLRKMKLTKRVQRPVAERVIADLVAEIERINARHDLLAWIDEADLFGSFVSGSSEVGDVDVAVRLMRRLSGDDWIRASLDRAAAAGVKGNFISRLCWGDEEVLRALRKVSRHIDVQDKGKMEELGFELRPLYRRGKGPLEPWAGLP